METTIITEVSAMKEKGRVLHMRLYFMKTQSNVGAWERVAL